MKLKTKHRPDTQSDTRDSDRSFRATMADTTHAMPGYKRSFSAFLHARTVWFVSDIVGRTIMRPNAILFGAVLAFVFTIGTYLLAKNLGYSLSGSESVSAFFVGWIVGIAFDILSSLRKKQ